MTYYIMCLHLLCLVNMCTLWKTNTGQKTWMSNQKRYSSEYLWALKGRAVEGSAQQNFPPFLALNSQGNSSERENLGATVRAQRDHCQHAMLMVKCSDLGSKNLHIVSEKRGFVMNLISQVTKSNLIEWPQRNSQPNQKQITIKLENRKCKNTGIWKIYNA